MFESVLERDHLPRSVAGPAMLAIGVHAVALVAALWAHGRPSPVIEEPKIRAMAILSRTMHPSIELAGAGAQTPKPRGEHVRTRSAVAEIDKNRKRVDTANVATNLDTGRAPPERPSASDSDGASENSVNSAVGSAGAMGTGAAIGAAGSTITLPFGEGMTRPTALAQPAPTYTREASAARSAGVVSARCVLTAEGWLRDCRIARGVPYMDAAVLEALSKWKYTPVTFQGRPVSVYYSINVRLVAP